ncbi:thiol-disulfide oxidoreductase DCC family protein [Mongoliibacter ruber]|uniref:Putative DCC family thiol-disulfide oxidoreductase YuxK n=1 Tax=Mongoliibacter ruber TaxID=1750599 RepID=A0A2T0WLS8_9BACT|nr:DCC1-like thiol-disulfide oxidoreductase family protein [Mongoliibacter ruber]PRY87668.1 putative DCC family thiol-disulfide oxidoreductase YuxK [Mongoliibacter ruber]
MRVQDKYDIVMFDGVCNLCNDAVDFIMLRDKNDKFKFGALQEDTSKEILKEYKVKEGYLDSIILIKGDNIFYKSRAALEIAKNLSGLWPMTFAFIIIPSFIRDPIYDWIARNRYKWFGKRETCRFPSEEERAKFLEGR